MNLFSKLNPLSIIILLLVLSTILNAKGKWVSYKGLVSSNIQIKGFEDAYLNDFDTYYAEDPNSANNFRGGSYGYLDLKSKNLDTTTNGLLEGSIYMLTHNQGVVNDFVYIYSGAASVKIINGGYKYITTFKDLEFSAIAKVGYAIVSVDMGELAFEGVDGFTYVLANGQKYDDGDIAIASSSGAIVSLSSEFVYKWTPKFKSFFQLGYQVSYFLKPTLRVKDKPILNQNVALLDDNVDATQESVYGYRDNNKAFDNVKISIEGIIIAFGADYKL
jgi:hypothetical protein